MTNAPANQPNHNSQNSHEPLKASEMFNSPNTPAEKSDDPIILLLQEQWKNIATVLLAALALVYFIQSFQESYEVSMRSAADLIHRVQLEYRNYEQIQNEIANIPSDDKEITTKTDDAKKRLAETRSQIEQLLNSAADAREPYNTISTLYRALLNKKENPRLAAETLSAFKDFKNMGKEGSEERFYAELGALQLGKLLIQDESRSAEGKSLLESLAKDGEVSSVAAASSLLSFAKNDEEATKTKQFIENLAKEKPAQAELFNQVIKGS